MYTCRRRFGGGGQSRSAAPASSRRRGGAGGRVPLVRGDGFRIAPSAARRLLCDLCMWTNSGYHIVYHHRDILCFCESGALNKTFSIVQRISTCLSTYNNNSRDVTRATSPELHRHFQTDSCRTQLSPVRPSPGRLLLYWPSSLPLNPSNTYPPSSVTPGLTQVVGALL